MVENGGREMQEPTQIVGGIGLPRIEPVILEFPQADIACIAKLWVNVSAFSGYLFARPSVRPII